MFFVQNALIINTKTYYLLCNLLLLKKNIKKIKKLLDFFLKSVILYLSLRQGLEAKGSSELFQKSP